jgi:DNA polymerase I-like protein with 3'-5' exonuclease and polymerase domains
VFDAPALSPGHTIVRSPGDLTTMVNAMRSARSRAVDFETNGLRWWRGNKPVGYSMGFIDGDNRIRAWYVPVAHRSPEPQVNETAAKAAFRDALAGSDEIVGQNLKFELNMGRANGYEIPEFTPLHDTLIQAYLINENRNFDLEGLVADLKISPYGSAYEMKERVAAFLTRRAKEHKLPLKRSDRGSDYTYLGRFGHAEVPIPLEAEYSCRDIGHSLVLDRVQRHYALGIGAHYQARRAVLYTNEMLLIRALADMEFVGQLLDIDYLGRFGLELDAYLDQHGRDLQRAFGATIEWNNDGHVRDLLYGHLKLPVFEKTDSGQPSVDKGALMALRSYHPGIELLAEWRQRFKVRSTYTDTLIEKVGHDGRLHGDFVQWGTATGRLSSRNPNLQNIPSRHKVLSKAVRRAWVIEPGMCRVHCDYSQIELRLLGWTTGCPNFVTPYKSPAYDAYVRGDIDYNTYVWHRIHEPKVDVHANTARNVFGVVDGDPGYETGRSASKIINFGVPYGGGPALLMGDPNLRLSPADAQAYFEDYHRKNPEITHSKNNLFHHMKGNRDGGFGPSFVNWAGRVRHGPRLLWNRRRGGDCPVAEEERSMFASLIQGSAGELTRFALVKLWWAQRTGKLPARTTTTIHDDIGSDCAKSDRRYVAYEVRRHMEDFKGLFGPIPVVAEIEVTETNWAEKAKYEPLKEVA